jgi:hypothetical protein
LGFDTAMRVLILFVTAVVMAGCAGQSTPDASPAPVVAAPAPASTAPASTAAASTAEVPVEVETVEATELVSNEQFCTMRTVTGSIRKQRVCRGRNTTGVEEAVDQQEIQEVLRGIERNHATGDLMNR